MISARILGWARAAAAAVLLLSAGCTIQLVPAGDPALVEALDAANVEAQTLFAAVEGGSPQSDFAALSGRYDAAIGGLRALKMRAAARPVPALTSRLAETAEALAPGGGLLGLCDAPEECVNASPSQIGLAADNLAKMRATHAERGLAPGVPALFRDAHEISMAQALKIETALAAR